MQGPHGRVVVAANEVAVPLEQVVLEWSAGDAGAAAGDALPMLGLTQLSNCLTLEGSFSSLSTATIARKDAFCSIKNF